MNIVEDTHPHAFTPSVATIGFFDGVHLGHRHLIGQVKIAASQCGWCSSIITFPGVSEFVLFCGVGIVGPFQQIVYGHPVEIRNPNERGGWDINVPAFIVAVYALAAPQNFSHLDLGQALVLPQCANSLIHHDQSFLVEMAISIIL